MEMLVDCRRWGQASIKVERTTSGWSFRYLAVGGEGDQTGEPALSRCLDQPPIAYPSLLPVFMAELWDWANRENWSDERIQERLNVLAEWVSIVERSTPPDLTND